MATASECRVALESLTGRISEMDAEARRFTARSDDVVAVAMDPGSFARAWLSGRLKVEGNFFDLLHLRRLL